MSPSNSFVFVPRIMVSAPVRRLPKLVPAVPLQVRLLWPVLRIAGQKEPVAIEVGELLAGYAFLDEPLLVHEYPVIVAD